MNNDTPRASFIQKIKHVIASFGATEKLVFGIAALLFTCGILFIVNTISHRYMTEVAINGGSVEEGIIGYASSINPVLAYTDADKDLSALIYSGLLKATPTGLQPDLAQSIQVSDDGLTYDVVLKPHLTFHDGSALTADDIIFTIGKVIDPAIDSPKAANWAGVGVEKVSDSEIKFTLKKAYAGFSENLTLGILPMHKWEGLEAGLFSRSTNNQEPVGSGPYRIKTASKNSTGLYEYYDLVPFANYAEGAAHISHVVFRFFRNENDAVDAYKSGAINMLGGISVRGADALSKTDANIKRIPLPRSFAVFFNESNAPVLLNSEVRQALNMAVDRNAIISDVLMGYGTKLDGPIPPGFKGEDMTAITPATSTSQLADAQALLALKGWKANENGVLEKTIAPSDRKKSASTQTLAFSISTSNIPELKRTAELLAAQWKALGANVSVKIFEPADLTQKVIKTRKYDSILFGNAVGRDLDLYPFWHSSQRSFPGLNIAEYANIKADKFLEQARVSTSTKDRDIAYLGFEQEMINDIPAVFLYSPQYIYVTSPHLRNLSIADMTIPSERFMTIQNWYILTEKVWNIFIPKDK